MRYGPTLRVHRSTSSRDGISDQMIGRRKSSAESTKFLDFVRSMLQADPTRRPTAADVVASTFWVTPVRQYGSDGDVRMEGLPHSGMLAGMPSSTRLSTTPTTTMSGASHDTANDGEVGDA